MLGTLIGAPGRLMAGRRRDLALGKSLALDFAGGRYRGASGLVRTDPLLVPGVTFTRTGSLLSRPPGGRYQLFPTNVPAITPGGGFAVYDARTNKNTNPNAAPADLTNVAGINGAVVTVVTPAQLPAAVAAAFEASPLRDVVTKLYRVVTPGVAGNEGIRFEPTAGSLLAHVGTAWVYNAGPSSGRVKLSGGSGAGGDAAANYGVTAAFERWSTVPGPLSVTDRYFMVTNGNGGVVEMYVALNQYEQAAAASPPIIGAGAATSRGADAMFVAGAGGVPPGFLVRFVAEGLLGATQYVGQWDDGGSNSRVVLFVDAGGVLRLQTYVGGANQGLVNLGAVVAGVTYTVAARMQTNNVRAYRNDGVTDADAVVDLPAITTRRIGCNVSGLANLCGRILTWFEFTAPPTDADLQRLVA